MRLQKNAGIQEEKKMRYDPLSKRLINVAYPLAVYLGIGLLVLGLCPWSGLTENLIEKTICAVAMGWLFVRDSRVIWWERTRAPLPVWLFPVLAGAGACIGINLLFSETGLKELLGSDAQAVSEALYTDSLWLELLTIGIAAPVAEELLFRGIIYRRLRTWLGVLPAAAAALLIFALIHGNLLQGFYALLLGSVIIWSYERFCGILAPILVHMAANLVSVLVTEQEPLSRLLQKMPLFWCIVGLAATSAAIGLTELIFRRRSPGDMALGDTGKK